MDFYGLKRKQLQELCKKHGIRANMKNVEMADRLTQLFQKEEEPEKAGKRGRTCLKNGGEIVEVVDDENVVEDSKEVKKVRFSPENQTFLFERTDPRAVRLLARKKRAVAKLKEKENPIGISDVFEEFGTSVEVSDDLGRVEEPKEGRNLRRGVVIAEDGGNLVKLGDKGGNLDRNLRCRKGKDKDESVEMITLMSPCVGKGRNLRRNSRKSVVQAEVSGIVEAKEGNIEVISLLSPCGGDNEERDVAGGNLKRSLRSRGGKANESNVGVVSLLSPCDNKKAKRRRNGKGIVEESGGEGVGIPVDEMKRGDDTVTEVSDCNKPKKRGRPRKTVALVEQVKAALVSDGEGCPNEDAVESLSQHCIKKPDPVGSDHLSVISEPEIDDLSEEVMAGLEAIPECEKVDVQMPSDDDCPTPSLSRNADEIGSSKDRECSSELVPVSDCNLKDRNASTPSSYIERTSNSPSSCSKSAQDLSGAIPAGEEQPTISLDENEGGLRASETFEENQNQLLHGNDGGRIMPLSNKESMPAESPSPSKKGDNGTVGDNDFQSVNYKDEVDHRMVARLSTPGLEGSNCSTERPVTVETDNSLSDVSEEVKAVLDAIPEYEKVNMQIPSDDDCPTPSLSRNGGEVGDSKDRESYSELVALSDCNFKDINASTPSSYIEGTSNSPSFCSKSAQELSGAAPAGEQPSITLDEHEADLRASGTFEDNQNQVLDVNIGGRIMQSSNEESMPAESPSPSKKGEIGTVGDNDFHSVNYKDEFANRMVARVSTPGLERSNCSTERPVAVETDESYSQDSLSGASEHGCLIAVKPSTLESSGQISSSLLKRDGNLVESETFESNDAPELYSNKTFNQSQEEDRFQELPCVSREESALGTSDNVDYELNDQVTEQEKGSVYTGPCDSVFKESNQTTPVISIGPVLYGAMEKGEQSCKETSEGRFLCLASDNKIDFCSQRNKPPYVQPDHADNCTERISENLLCGDDSLHFTDLAGCTSASCVSKSRKLIMDDAAGDFFDVEQKAERFSEANSFSPSSSHKLYVAHSTMSLVDIREESSSVKVAVENPELKVETLANDNASTPLLQSTGDGRPDKAQETPAEFHAVGYTFQEEIATPELSSKVGSSLRSMEEQLDNSTSEQLKHASSSKDFESSLQRLFTEDSTYTGFTRHPTDCQLDASLSEHLANDNECHHMDEDVDQLNANKVQETPADLHAVGCTFQEELATPELSSKVGSSLRSMEEHLDNSPSEQLKQESSSKDFDSSLQRLFTEDSTYTGCTRHSTDQLDASLSEHVANDNESHHMDEDADQLNANKAEETPAEFHAVGYTFQEELATPELSSKGGSSLRSMEAQLDNSTSEQLKQERSSKDFESSLQRLFTEDSTYTGFTRGSTDFQLDVSLNEHVANDDELLNERSEATQFSMEKPNTIASGDSTEACSLSLSEEPEVAELCLETGDSIQLEQNVDKSQDTSHATQLPPSSSPQLSVAYETAMLEDICEEKDTYEMTYGKAKESAPTPFSMKKSDNDPSLKTVEALYENSNIEQQEKANNTTAFKFSLKHLFSENDIFDTDGNTKSGEDDCAEDLQCTRSIRQAAAPKVDASLNEKVADDNECLSMDNLNVKNESLDGHLVTESSEARECTIESGDCKYTKEFASGGSDCSPSMMQNSNSGERAQNLPLELVAICDNIFPEEFVSTSINDEVILSDTSHSPVEDQESLNASEPVNCFTVCHTIIATSEVVNGNEELLFGSSSELEGRMTESKASESNIDLLKLPASENEMGDTMLDSVVGLSDDQLTAALAEQEEVARSMGECGGISKQSGGGEQLNESNSEEKELVAGEGSGEGRVQIQSSSAVKEDMNDVKLLPDDATDSERKTSMLESDASVKAGVIGTSTCGSRDRGEETSNETTIGSVSCSEDCGKADTLALADMPAFKQTEEANDSNQPNLQHLVPEYNLVNKDEKGGLETETTLGENEQDSVSLLDWNQSGLEFNLSANDNTADLNSLFMEFMANDMGEMFQAGNSIPCMQLEERNHTLDSLCDNYPPHVSESLKYDHDNKGDMVESEEHNLIGWHSATEMHDEVTSEASLNDMSDIIACQNQAEFAHGNSVQGNCVEPVIAENISLCGSEKKAGKTEEMTEDLTDGLLMHSETAVLVSGNEYKFEEEKNTDKKIVQQNGNDKQVDDHTDTVHDAACNSTIYQLAFEQAIDHTDTVHDDHTDTIHDTFGTSVSDPCVQDEKSLNSEASMLYNVDQAADGTEELGCGLVTNVRSDVEDKGNKNSQNVKTEDAAEDANDSLLLHKRNRSILIHGTPRKPLLSKHDMKENTPALKRLQMVNATATKPLLKRKVLGEIQK